MAIDAKTGEWVSFDFWKTEVDAQRIEKSGEFLKIIERGEGIGLQNMKRQVFEVAADEAAPSKIEEIFDPWVGDQRPVNITINL